MGTGEPRWEGGGKQGKGMSEPGTPLTRLPFLPRVISRAQGLLVGGDADVLAGSPLATLWSSVVPSSSYLHPGVQVCGGPGPAISRDLSSGLPLGLDAVAPGAAATLS